jgi:hypothetical protein
MKTANITLSQKLQSMGIDPNSPLGKLIIQIRDALREFEASKQTTPDSTQHQDSESS